MAKKLEELQDELDADTVINPLSLQSEAADIPKLWSKWLRYHTNAKKQIATLQSRKEITYKELMLLYTGRSDQMCDIIFDGATEVKIAINGDTKMVDIVKLIQYFEVITEFTGKALDIIKNKGYAIKNMLEIRKLESGA
ncbi:ssDNA binding protein [Pantoea phage Phynn]|nr:ssDNA binding protein [Pantoea phage Phynn]